MNFIGAPPILNFEFMLTSPQGHFIAEFETIAKMDYEARKRSHAGQNTLQWQYSMPHPDSDVPDLGIGWHQVRRAHRAKAARA